MRDEFYDIYQIYEENGIKPQISLNENLLKRINRSGIYGLTNGFLSQKKLENVDCLLLKFNDGFERILIFDREGEEELEYF